MPFPSLQNLPDLGSNLGLPHVRHILYCLSHQGSPATRPLGAGHEPEKEEGGSWFDSYMSGKIPVLAGFKAEKRAFFFF